MSQVEKRRYPGKKDSLIELGVLQGIVALRRDRERAAPIIEELLGGKRDWSELTASERRLLEGVPLIDVALQKSFDLRYRDPAGMLRLAIKAQVLANGLSPRKYGAKVLADIKARVWTELGNAYRVAEDTLAAEEALAEAADFARRGTGALRVFARISDVAASLFADERSFVEACECLSFVHSAYESLGEFHLAGRALIKRGLFAGREGYPEKAIALLAQGWKKVSPGKDLKLEIAALHGLALNLVDIGEHHAAHAALARLRRLHRRNRSRTTQLRLHWLEGRIASGQGDLGQAEAALQVARLGFQQLKQFRNAALVSLDLALLYAKLGKRLQIRRLAQEMITTFRAYRIAREAIASLLLLRKTCDQDGVSMDLLRGQIETLSLMLAELERRPARGRRGSARG